jgi:restriction endonuclease S subunit
LKGNVPWFTIEDIRDSGRIIKETNQHITQEALKETSVKLLPRNSVLLCCTASVGEYAFAAIELATNQQFNGLVVNKRFVDKLLPRFLFAISPMFKDELIRLSGKTSFNFVSVKTLKEVKIPLPPISLQEEIVAEIESYQKIIDGARMVVENYKPRIDIDPEWKMVELGELCENHDYKRRPVEKSLRKPGPYPYYGASGIVDYVDSYIFDGEFLLVSEDGANLLARSTPIAFPITGKTWVNNHAHITKFESQITQKFVEIFLNQTDLKNYITGMAQPKLNQEALNKIPVQLPEQALQAEIVKRVEQEENAIQANKKLIDSFNQKIKDRIAKVWGSSHELNNKLCQQ